VSVNRRYNDAGPRWLVVLTALFMGLAALAGLAFWGFVLWLAYTLVMHITGGGA
jgi:hypothetical protein